MNSLDKFLEISRRHDRIVGLLSTFGLIAAKDLAKMLEVSVQTVRADLRRLQQEGRIVRRHGVAEPTPAGENTSYKYREAVAQDDKSRIAAQIARIVPNGARLALGTGTTVEMAARALSAHVGLSVTTNSLHAVMALQSAPDISISMCGGDVRLRDLDVIGADSVEFFGAVTVDYAITSVGGIGEDGSLMDYNRSEVRTRTALTNCGRTKVLVADASKFDRTPLCRHGHATDFDIVVTTAAPSPAIAKALAGANRQLIIAG